jgi:immune inhibitor A
VNGFIRKMGAILVALAILIGAYLVLGVITIEACPAGPVVKTFVQPDGTPIQLRLWGDEFVHGWETLDGYTVVKNTSTGFWEYAILDSLGELVPSSVVARQGSPPAKPHLRPSLSIINASRAARGAPAMGVLWLATAPPWAGADTDVLFIAVEFTDVACTFTDAQMETNLFGGGATGPGDLDDYFDEISYGNLELDGHVEGDGGCYQLANARTHYDEGPGSARSLVQEAIALADPDVDFSIYDNDGDGFVDALGIIYAGGAPHDGCETDDDGEDYLWPHSWWLASAVSVDGVQVYDYVIQSEITWALADGVCDEMQTIGLFAHEFGHALGLPDLYDTDYSSRGVGHWSAMASQSRSTVNQGDTPPHYDPWSKWFEGWITPVVYTGLDVGATLPQVETDPFVIQLLANPGGAEQGGSGEYFLVENRQQTNFDSRIPGCGLLIWHIEESQTHNQNEGHTTASHRLVDLEEADGQDDLDTKANRGDAGDPYPGTSNNRLFDDASYPTANLYDGSPSGVRIADISDCDAVMSANFGNPAADVSIAKIDSPDPVIAGEQLLYEITVRNDGPGVATNVQVVDVLPAGVSFVPDTDTCVGGPVGTLTCDLGTMLIGEEQVVTITVDVDSDLVASAGSPASISNTASVTADQPDDDLTNNDTTATTAVEARADLLVTKSDAPDPVLAGEMLTYEVTVQNNGPSMAVDVMLVDTLPDGVSLAGYTLSNGSGACALLEGSPDRVECELDDLNSGESVTVLIEVLVAPSVPHGTIITNAATVSSATLDPNGDNNTAAAETEVRAEADLAIAKDANYETANPSRPIVYTVRVVNRGPSDAQRVVMVDSLPLTPKKIVYKRDSGGGACAYNRAAHTVTCRYGTLAPGASVSVDIEVDARGSVRWIKNIAEVTTSTTDPKEGNNRAVKEIYVKGGPKKEWPKTK